MKLCVFIPASILFALSGNVTAASIVDTGVITCDNNTCAGSTFSSVINPDDLWAASFTLASSATISDMQVWINAFQPRLNTTFTMALYGDDVTAPDTTNEIFSQSVLITDKGIEDSDGNQWQGLSNLNINLSKGDYWLSLEIRNGNNYDGYIPTGQYGALNTAGAYAFFNPLNGIWIEDPTSDFAFKIDGNISTIPVPAAIWLFSFGLVSLLGVAKRKSAG